MCWQQQKPLWIALPGDSHPSGEATLPQLIIGKHGPNTAWTFFRCSIDLNVTHFLNVQKSHVLVLITYSINLTHLSCSQEKLFLLELFSFLLRTNIFCCSVCDIHFSLIFLDLGSHPWNRQVSVSLAIPEIPCS